MAEESPQNPLIEHPQPPVPDELIVRSEDLFSARTEIVIVHNGERYRLRLTRRGKLILQK